MSKSSVPCKRAMRSSGFSWEGIRPKYFIVLGRMSTGIGIDLPKCLSVHQSGCRRSISSRQSTTFIACEGAADRRIRVEMGDKSFPLVIRPGGEELLLLPIPPQLPTRENSVKAPHPPISRLTPSIHSRNKFSKPGGIARTNLLLFK